MIDTQNDDRASAPGVSGTTQSSTISESSQCEADLVGFFGTEPASAFGKEGATDRLEVVE